MASCRRSPQRIQTLQNRSKSERERHSASKVTARHLWRQVYQVTLPFFHGAMFWLIRKKLSGS